MSFLLVPRAQETLDPAVPTQTPRRFLVPLGNGMLIELKGSGAGSNMCLVSGFVDMGDHAVLYLTPQLELSSSPLSDEPIRATLMPDRQILQVHGSQYVYDIIKSQPIAI